MKNISYTTLILLSFLLGLGCSDDNERSNPPQDRRFNMGFTSWSFGPSEQDVNDTYAFINTNADIYTEHIDNKIPWNAWINDLPLPEAFTNEITGRISRRIAGKKLLLSLGPLNLDRDELAQDLDGSIPTYTNLDDAQIEEGYFRHVDYLISQFAPDYLVIAIEVNELRLKNNAKWEEYKTLIQNVKARVKQSYPNLPISESVSLHNLYEPDIPDPEAYIDDIINHMNQLDFVTISYYPFLKNQSTTNEFQQTLDFLHSRITKPIAFSESGHIAENLIIPNLDVSINGNPEGQQAFLETLLNNAGEQGYEFVIWWSHRDYDALWEVFPPELKDLGQLWRDTGLLDESGNARLAKSTWDSFFNR